MALITPASIAPCCSAKRTLRSSRPAPIASLATRTRWARSCCHSRTHTFTSAARVVSVPGNSPESFVTSSVTPHTTSSVWSACTCWCNQSTAPAVRYTSSSRASRGSTVRGKPNVATAFSASARSAAFRCVGVFPPWRRHRPILFGVPQPWGFLHVLPSLFAAPQRSTSGKSHRLQRRPGCRGVRGIEGALNRIPVFGRDPQASYAKVPQRDLPWPSWLCVRPLTQHSTHA